MTMSLCLMSLLNANTTEISSITFGGYNLFVPKVGYLFTIYNFSGNSSRVANDTIITLLDDLVPYCLINVRLLREADSEGS